jgi:hypothetical protein
MAQVACVEVQAYDPGKPEALVARGKALKARRGAVLVIANGLTQAILEGIDAHLATKE